MKDLLPENLISLAASCPFPLYAVGGAVRDFLGGLTRSRPDWDICAPVSLQIMRERALSAGFSVLAEYAYAGSLKLSCGGDKYEFTCFRTDEYGKGGHRPVRIRFTDDISLDARRRDFTCNAVYYDISGGQFVDPFGGMSAIAQKKLIPCAEPDKLFSEDGARIIRLARFSGELGFGADADCVRAAADSLGALASLSRARIWSEVRPIFSADEKYGIAGGCARTLRLLEEISALGLIFPSLSGSGAVESAISAAERAPCRLRLCAFIYAAEAENDLSLYPLTSSERDCSLIAAELRSAPDGDCRTFIQSHCGDMENILALARVVGDGRAENLGKTFSDMKEEGVPFSVGQLAVRGDDLISAGIAPQSVGETLSFLLSQCAFDASLNVRQTLISMAYRFYRRK